jgi:hypothetical protein
MKCTLSTSEIVFKGHKLTRNEIKPTQDKVEAISKFGAPTTTREVRSSLGLVNFVGRFITNLTTMQ